MSTSARTAPAPQLTRAHWAVLGIFALAGISFSSWASRIPDAKAALDLSAGQLGATLLFASIGSLIALPSAGRIADRFGVVRTVRYAVIGQIFGMLLIGLGIDEFHSRAVVCAGLLVVGLTFGTWDVAMNLEGAIVERELARTVMPHYHAAYSGGTVLSALIGAGLSYLQVPIVVHLVVSSILILVLASWSLRSFLPVEPEEHEPDAPQASAGSAWFERKTLLIGLVTLSAAFAEGTANDWLSVAFVEGHDLPNWAGVLAFATFLGFMTVGRLLGTNLLDRYGRILVLRVTFAMAIAGALLVVYGSPWLAFIGAAIWGIGASLGFPVGMSASADDPKRAAARMSVVATIGYTAFIAGPPLLGFLGDHFGVLHSLLVVAALTVLGALILPAVREPERDPASAAASEPQRPA